MLKCNGIAPSVIYWVESYLRRLSFQVSVNESLSQVTEAASGVPKGSVYGPILFAIYVNDFADTLMRDHLRYADDVKVSPPPKTSGCSPKLLGR